MIKAGLTGSIGMGKSTTAEMFRAEGILVYDADATVHELYKNEAVELVEKNFPGTERNGQIDRQELAKRVLGNQEEMKKLESIIHPLVHKKEREFTEKAKSTGEQLIILDIPLLFEAGGYNRVDRIIVVTAPFNVQRDRVLSRPEMTEDKFQAILSRQVPDEEKRNRADYVIDTSKGMDAARREVSAIIKELTQNSVQHD
ncbi:MAG: dephospho-CoA kinase [Rhizobiaceae bacterium]